MKEKIIDSLIRVGTVIAKYKCLYRFVIEPVRFLSDWILPPFSFILWRSAPQVFFERLVTEYWQPLPGWLRIPTTLALSGLNNE
jgi:hypothetical protein